MTTSPPLTQGFSDSVIEDTTLVSSYGTDGITEDAPVDYLTVRITIPHIDVKRMLTKLFLTGEVYVCYLHKGSKTNKEHVHILVPDMELKKKLNDRIRYHLKLSGNKEFSIKGMHNGLMSGIQYCAKESTRPILSDDNSLLKFIEAAPKWVFKENISNYMEPPKSDKAVRDWQLTYANLVPQAVLYAKKNGLAHDTLKRVCKHMFEHTRWAPSKWMVVGGVPEFYENQFEFRMGRDKDIDMNWWRPRQ